MSDKLNRLKKLESAKTSTDYKNIKLKGLTELVDNLQKIAADQQKAQTGLIESVNKIVEAINNKDNNSDNEQIANAIEKLQLAIMQNNTSPPTDYHLSGKRTKNGLIDLDSIKFKAVSNKGLH